jgi:topoisomerase-4 subunit A
MASNFAILRPKPDETSFILEGIKALGNQLTTDKIKQINLLDSLPFEEPEEIEPEKMEVNNEENLLDDIKTDLEEDGQITLSLE